MTEWHLRSKRRKTGGRRTTLRRTGKKLAWKGGIFAATKINTQKQDALLHKGVGSTKKLKLKDAMFANVLDPKAKKTQKLPIITVVENQANREYARRNIITKGALIEVKKDSETLKAKVSSRPGQDGIVNAVLVQ